MDELEEINSQRMSKDGEQQQQENAKAPPLSPKAEWISEAKPLVAHCDPLGRANRLHLDGFVLVFVMPTCMR